MKTRLVAVTLAMALLLSGCSSLFQRSYYSSTDHVDYTVEEDSSVLRAESYRGLVDAMLYFVNEHLSRGGGAALQLHRGRGRRPCGSLSGDHPGRPSERLRGGAYQL